MTNIPTRTPTDPEETASQVEPQNDHSQEPPVPQQPAIKGKRDSKKVFSEIRKEIVRLHEFYGTRQIAERVGWSRKVVRRVLKEEGLSSLPPAGDVSKLTPFLQQIDERALKRLTVTRILREIRELGYRGGRSILATHISEFRVQNALELPRKDVKRRFETAPGKEMQVDWSPFRVLIAGHLVLVHCLAVILCCCRKLFVAFYRDEKEHTLLEGLATAFAYFNGCAIELVLDNMTTAVLGRIGPDRKPIWHPLFIEFTRYYGYKPVACRVRHPNRKGKIEKPYRFVFDDFLNGAEFRSWEHLETECSRWLDGRRKEEVCNWRVHGTTGERPNEAYLAERDFLIRLPRERFPVYDDSDRIVDNDATLSIGGRKYSIPTGLANRTVRVHLFAHYFEVVGLNGQVAFSRSYAGPDEKRKTLIDPTLYAGLPRRPLVATNRERLDEAFLRRFPMLAPLVDGLKVRMKTLAPIHLRKLLRLAEQYGPDAFLTAAQRAQTFKRFDALAVARILEQAHAEPVDKPITPLTGGGAAVLGDVDSGSLEGFGHLDQELPTRTNTTADAGDDIEADNDDKSTKEGSDGTKTE
jgi:transposase